MSGIVSIAYEFPETLGLHHQVLIIFLQRSLNKMLLFMKLDSHLYNILFRKWPTNFCSKGLGFLEKRDDLRPAES